MRWALPTGSDVPRSVDQVIKRTWILILIWLMNFLRIHISLYLNVSKAAFPRSMLRKFFAIVNFISSHFWTVEKYGFVVPLGKLLGKCSNLVCLSVGTSTLHTYYYTSMPVFCYWIFQHEEIFSKFSLNKPIYERTTYFWLNGGNIA